MRVLNERGREVVWRINKYRVMGDDARQRSSLHSRARILINDAYLGDVVYEEVPLPNSLLRFDFVVPSRKVVVEVNGEQHYKPSSHMHGTSRDFYRSGQRDAKKAEFCLMNDFRLVELRFDESNEIWMERLLGD